MTRVEFLWQNSGPGRLLAAIRESSDSEELVDWQTILGGTFSILFEVVSDSSMFESASDPDTYKTGRLRLRTGRLVLTTGAPGEAAISVLSLTPGVYAFKLRWFIDEEARHNDIGSVDEYPMGEGPEGVLTLFAESTLTRLDRDASGL